MNWTVNKWPRAARSLWAPLGMILALAPLILTQILQMLSLVVLPFSRSRFRRINTAIAGGIWGYWAWSIQRVLGVDVVVTGDELPYREDAIVLANHQSMVDIAVLLVLAARKGSVRHLKWLAKDILKYVPGVGWGMMFLDCVFLKRNWLRDEATIKRTFALIADNKLPVWLVSFPEGTRVTPAKLSASLAKEREKALAVGDAQPPLRHLLRPRYKGFHASLIGLGDHVKAVYVVGIGYYGAALNLYQLIRGDAQRIDLRVRRIPIDQVPRVGSDTGHWLDAEFRRMDDWLAVPRSPQTMRS